MSRTLIGPSTRRRMDKVMARIVRGTNDVTDLHGDQWTIQRRLGGGIRGPTTTATHTITASLVQISEPVASEFGEPVFRVTDRWRFIASLGEDVQAGDIATSVQDGTRFQVKFVETFLGNIRGDVDILRN